MKKQEAWTKEDWVVTISLLCIMPPIGIAALMRKWCGKRVWHPEQFNEGW